MTGATTTDSLADLLVRLGGISPARVRADPPPGRATVADVVAIERRESRLFELVDGALVEKVMGYRESLIAAYLVKVLASFVDARNLGLVSGSDGMVHLFPGMVRIPDAAFVSWARVPGGRVPAEPVPSLVPDLAIEVVSSGNTEAEMTRKVGEYLAAGVRLVWRVDADRRAVTVEGASRPRRVLGEGESLDGGEVLPGFTLDVGSIFAVLERHEGV